MARIWNHSTKLMTNKHKQITPHTKVFGVGVNTTPKPHTSSLRGRPKVFVGLSGGVDSSVSAALLKDATPNNFEKLFGRPTPKGFRGYDVTGVFIRVWQPGDDSPSTGSTGSPQVSSGQLHATCNWKEDRLDAMRVCAKLDIPFVTLDLSKEYKKEVVDYMIAEYRAGNTPNPDVMCNRYVKFGGFYDWAMKNGADFVATGHYARIMEHGTQNMEQKKGNSLHAPCSMLCVACDTNKDQSYFLWTLTQEQLTHTLFPVGNLEKPAVRKLAKKFGLVTAEKKDSQGLCFLGKIDVKDFLKQFIKEKTGNVLNEKGEAIGKHSGAFFYTLGERHGFTSDAERTPVAERSSLRGVALKKSEEDAQAAKVFEARLPYYVIAKDVKKNTLTVSHDSKAIAQGQSRTVFELKNVNWIGPVPAAGTGLHARLRYRQPLQSCTLECATPGVAHSPSVFYAHFSQAQSGGASGQSIVFYDGDRCLGGGVIV